MDPNIHLLHIGPDIYHRRIVGLLNSYRHQDTKDVQLDLNQDVWIHDVPLTGSDITVFMAKPRTLVVSLVE